MRSPATTATAFAAVAAFVAATAAAAATVQSPHSSWHQRLEPRLPHQPRPLAAVRPAAAAPVYLRPRLRAHLRRWVRRVRRVRRVRQVWRVGQVRQVRARVRVVIQHEAVLQQQRGVVARPIAKRHLVFGGHGPGGAKEQRAGGVVKADGHRPIIGVVEEVCARREHPAVGGATAAHAEGAALHCRIRPPIDSGVLGVEIL